jgi:malonyl-CoA decarboxylase
MSGLLPNLLKVLRERRDTDTSFLCRELLSMRGEASEVVLVQKTIANYKAMTSAQRLDFFGMLCSQFSPDQAAIRSAAAEYDLSPGRDCPARLSASVEPPRQEHFRRINTAPGRTEAPVAMRGHVLELNSNDPKFGGLDADLRYLFRS